MGEFRSVVGFFGFNHDRKLALRALAVSASGNDVHSVFAGLALMTYYGVVLLMSGYQADEKYILKQYKSIVDKCVHAPPNLFLYLCLRFLLKVNQYAGSKINTLQGLCGS